ncbi:zinc-binding alcohol dehydrogenase family protein [Microbacterium sp. STN6]|uniref:zinc-binding alcohol dehydrogenase family protein n=1 Tax=Microbacterium sp. STN6 TaxID=2995588 RepID=UPI002260A4EA|nr:zinc-binding alcohol dehydrogenase family protein [Microbacterium sp. STN6]MCX7521382.1 zinc-binding alcohol dehydrogenase family protein [Microbacterium sp. STN6]
MTPQNLALWLPKPGTRFEVGHPPYTPPGPGEVVVRVRAVSVNPIDGLPGIGYRLALPWLRFPAIIGSDVAGEVVETGAGVGRLQVGDRVLGMAVGVEKDRNRAAEGAFQRYVVLVEHMVSPIPDDLPFEQACVLPLALSTAATGLFQPDHLGLPLPTLNPSERGETVLIWGGSTSVGSNAIQLARAAGYRVIATCSPHNFGYLRSLGAAAAIDRTAPDAVGRLRAALGDDVLAGAYAIGSGSLAPTLAVASTASGPRRLTSAQPTAAIRLQLLARRRRGVHTTGVWGGTLRNNAVGPSIYAHYLPAALASGTYRAAPEAVVVGDGLEQIPVALDRLRHGVSAQKLVVRL